MSKYVGGYYTLRPKEDTLNKVLDNITQQMQMQRTEKDRQRTLQSLNDPNVSDIQKSISLASIDPGLARQYYKDTQRRSLVADVLGRVNTQGQPVGTGAGLNVPGMTPGINPYANVGNENQLRGSGFRQPPPVPQQQPNQLPADVNQQNIAEPLSEIEQQKEKAKRLRQAGNELSLIEPNLGRSLTDEANSIEKNIRQDRDFAFKREQAAKNAETELRKETSPYIDGVVNAYKGKKNQEAILNEMENLAKNRDLTTPLMNSLLGELGMPLGVLNNPDSEDFEKLSNNLTRDITKFYGARINQTEFINFLKQIPTLNNSEEGRVRVISSLKKMLMPIQLEYDIMKDLIEKNGGKPFPNMNFEVTKRMEPTLDKWAAEVNKEMNTVSDQTRPLAPNEVIMVFPDAEGNFTDRRRVPKADVGKWTQWGKLE